jgi:hypothetical protein
MRNHRSPFMWLTIYVLSLSYLSGCQVEKLRPGAQVEFYQIPNLKNIFGPKVTQSQNISTRFY